MARFVIKVAGLDCADGGICDGCKREDTKYFTGGVRGDAGVDICWRGAKAYKCRPDRDGGENRLCEFALG